MQPSTATSPVVDRRSHSLGIFARATSPDSRPELIRFFVTLLGSLALTWYLWGPLVHAYWWIIDDYRWVLLMAAHGRLSFTEMLAQFNPQDVHLGGYVNRPTYYAVNAMWCFLLGNNPTLWYVARIACPFLAIFAFWYALGNRMGLLLSGLVTLCLAVPAFWADIIPKSVSETFAATGSAILLLGVSFLLRPECLRWRESLSGTRAVIASVCILVGGIMAVGSKENFTVLILGAVICLLVLSIRAKHPQAIIRAYSAVIVWGAVILYYIDQGELRRDTDLYGVSISGRMALLQRYTFRLDVTSVLLVVYVFSLLAAGIVYVRRKRSLFDDLRPLLIVTGLQLYLVFTRIFLGVFYNGAVTKEDRYAFPYALLPIFSLVLLLLLLLELDLPGGRLKAARSNIRLVATCGFIVLALTGGLNSNRTAAERYTEATLAFKERLERVEATLRPNASTPLLFRSFADYDAEFLASVAKYLRVAGVQNPFYLSIGYDVGADKAPIENVMIAATKGMIGHGRTFRPESELPANPQPVVIVFSAPEPAPAALARFFPLP